MRTIGTNQAQKEVYINENFNSLLQASMFGWKVQTTSGLVFGYWGARWYNSSGARVSVADGTIALTASSTNYVYFNTSTNLVAVSTTLPTLNCIDIATIVTSTTAITSFTDTRPFALIPYGVPNNLSAPSNPYMTDKADFEVIGISALTITLKGPQALNILPTEYTAATTSVSGNITVTVTNSTTGYIVATTSGGAIAVTSLASNSNNILAILYKYTASGGAVTSLVDCTRSNLPRIIGAVYETSLAITGNLSKSNVFTTPWGIQNTSGNLSTSFRYEVFLKCLTAEQGYAVNDIISFTTGPVGSAYGSPPTLRAYNSNGTSLAVVLDAAVKAQSLTTFTNVDLTPANWQLRVRVYPIR